ncbi:MAG: LytTR family DNA-binding domain-containing protein [Pseudomonadota bacterium]
MRALIADDEPHLALYLRDQIALLWPELEIVHMSRNGIDAAQRIRELAPDLAFLDIQMPGLNGLEVAQGIEGNTRVVFVTAYDEHALAAFDHAALDYVLKPLKTERLARTLERIKQACTPAPPPRLRHIRAALGEMTHQIAVADVLFFQADDKYTVVRTANAEHLIRTTITELAAQLGPDRFRQIHRSTLINLDHLEGTRRDDASRLFVRVKGYAGELPVSRAFVHMFRAM